jgi:hypothetical protein
MKAIVQMETFSVRNHATNSDFDPIVGPLADAGARGEHSRARAEREAFLRLWAGESNLEAVRAVRDKGGDI